MSSDHSLPPWVPSTITPILSQSQKALLTSVVPPLLSAISQISNTLQHSLTLSLAGTANFFGDEQLNVDVSSETTIRKALEKCPLVVTASSEEDPVEKPVQHTSVPAQGKSETEDGEKFTVAFDPLDGSSIVGANWTVGTIIGIWKGTSALYQYPREKQVASILGVYGPRTTAIIALREPGQPGVCFEVFLSNTSEKITLLHPLITLNYPPHKTKYFAPANLRSAAQSQPYMSLISSFIAQQYTLRYIGGLVPDIVHALVKGHGVYISPVTSASKAKLRRLYELCPIALVIECVGGKAVDPLDGSEILGKEVGNCDERGGLVCGNKETVNEVMQSLR